MGSLDGLGFPRYSGRRAGSPGETSRQYAPH
ncbi:hypothetical protein SAMN06295924_103246 [Rathayibacter rathayi NCPPB 2980 = VKM Ac-1601]|nr:hypothetical protein FB469_2866 [Rathayibacter rathayi]SOE04176.1 hypothetical protein SAMN06295924_103246 [Rathayibacter rathayi NCPPB 2980 = VKM Ac-1601]